MTQFAWALAVALAASTLSGCGAIRVEASYPGGVMGKLSDDHLFPAPTKAMQAYRGLVVGTALARVAERNVSSSGAALTTVASINGVVATTSRLRELASVNCYKDNDGSPRESDDPNQCLNNAYSILFEAKLPDLYRELFLLGASALPTQVFGDIVSQATSGNYLGVLWDLLWEAGRIAEALENSLAVGRSSTEQRAVTYNWDAGVKPLLDAKKPFDVSVAGAMLSAINRGSMTADPDNTAFFAMASMMRESCLRIRKRIDDAVGNNCFDFKSVYNQKADHTGGLYPAQ